MRHVDRKEGWLAVALILFFPFLGGLTACGGTSAPRSATPVELINATPDFVSTAGHFSITFSSPWEMNQSNSIRVDVEIDTALILALEVAPQFAGESVTEKPVTVDGIPVAGHLEEVTGHLVLHRADAGVTSIAFTLPPTLFDTAQYEIGRELRGWKLRFVLTSEVVAYPAHGGRSLGNRYAITVEEVQAKQTWVESKTKIGSPEDAHLSIPDSSSGVFRYYRIGGMVDWLTLNSGLGFDFSQ